MTKKRLPIENYVAILINGNYVFGPCAFMILAIITGVNFFSTFDLDSFLYLRGNLELGQGEIINVFETDMGDEDYPYFGYDYTFYSPIGDLTWTSYSNENNFRVGDNIKIAYNQERPYVHRIEGMSNILGATLFFLMLILAMGWLIYNFIVGVSKIDIIRNGQLTKGNLFNNRTVSYGFGHEVSFSFTSQDKKSIK